jgi:hypothetical protein
MLLDETNLGGKYLHLLKFMLSLSHYLLKLGEKYQTSLNNELGSHKHSFYFGSRLCKNKTNTITSIVFSGSSLCKNETTYHKHGFLLLKLV